MVVEGTQLPCVFNEDATIIDVWRIDDDVAVTLSRSTGRIMAGTRITRDNWVKLNKYVMAQFRNRRKKS
jgi:hypothetical protein